MIIPYITQSTRILIIVHLVMVENVVTENIYIYIYIQVFDVSCKGDTRIRCFIPPESITEAYLLYIFTGIFIYVCAYAKDICVYYI